MEGFPREGTREEILAWIRSKKPKGTLYHHFKDSFSPELLHMLRFTPVKFLNNQPLENLKKIKYVPEVNEYATPEEVLIYIPFKEITKDIIFTRNGPNNEPITETKTLSNATLMNLFGSMPPYHGTTRPELLSSLDEFDFSILELKAPSLKIPTYPEGIKRHKSSFTEAKIQEYMESLRAEVMKTQEEFDAAKETFLTNEDGLEKIKALTQILKLRFKTYTLLSEEILKRNKTRPEDLILIYDNARYHSFLEKTIIGSLPVTGWKERERLKTDSKQLVFARAVGGLIIYLLKQIPPATILNPIQSNVIFDLFQTFTYELGATTFDMIAIGETLKFIVKEINEYVGYNLLVVDCENEGKTERCYRGVVLVDNASGKYRIILTDVTRDAVVSLENQIRLLGKYSGKNAEGGKRKTHKRRVRQKKTSRKNRK